MEDIQSSEEENEEGKDDTLKDKLYHDKGEKSPMKSESMSPLNNNIDESLFDETHVVQNEIRTMHNQL